MPGDSHWYSFFIKNFPFLKHGSARLQPFLTIGSELSHDPFLQASVRISNYTCMMAVSVSTFFCFVHLFFTQDMNGVVNCLLNIVLFLAPLFLNRRGLYRASQTLFLSICVFAIALGAYVTGYKSGFTSIFLVAFSLFYLAFVNEDAWKIVASNIILLLFFLAVEFNVGGFFDGVVHLSDSMNFSLSIVFKVTTIILVGIVNRFSVSLIYQANEQMARMHNLINERKNELSVMLQNLKQGILTIALDRTIDPEYSSQVLKILEQDSLAGKNIRQLLESGFNLSGDAINMITSALDAVLGEEDINFDLNEHVFPKNILFKGRILTKHLEIDWIPIKQNRRVIKILLSIRDDTESIAFKENKKSQNILLEMINSRIIDFESTYAELARHIEIAKTALKEAPNGPLPVEISRRIHTFKGESRFLGWNSLLESVNSIENDLDNLKVCASDRPVVQELLRKLEKDLLVYKNLYESHIQVLTRSTHLDELKKVTESLVSSSSKSQIRQHRLMIEQLKKTFTHRYLSDVLSMHRVEIRTVAKNLGKEEPYLDIRDNNIAFLKTKINFFSSVFSHLLVNAIDHGIEPGEVRASIGKPSQGRIWVEALRSPTDIEIHVWDDGAGLDLLKIEQHARLIDHPFASDQDLAKVIFKPAFSTRDTKTDYSGRGVGLNAVEDILQKNGCSIRLQLEEPIQDRARVHFHLVIVVPTSLATVFKE